MTRAEYLNFFANWLHRQFPRNSNLIRNTLINREVQLIVSDDEGAAYWANSSCWTMHDAANEQISSRAIVGVTAD